MLSLPQTVGSDQVQYKIFGEPWSIWLGFKKLSKCFRPNIKEIQHGMSLCQKWESKERFVFLASVNNIDWQPNHMAIKNSIVSRRRIGRAWDVAWDQSEHRNRILHGVDQGTCKVSTPNYAPSTHKAQHISLATSDFFPDLTPKHPSCGSSHTQCVAKTSLCGARMLVTAQKMEGYQQERQAIAAWLHINDNLRITSFKSQKAESGMVRVDRLLPALASSRQIYIFTCYMLAPCWMSSLGIHDPFVLLW